MPNNPKRLAPFTSGASISIIATAGRAVVSMPLWAACSCAIELGQSVSLAGMFALPASNGLVHLETGFNLSGFFSQNGNLKIGYAFDYNITALYLPLGSSHELHLSYLLDTGR